MPGSLGIAAMAGGLQGWLFRKTTVAERWMLIIAGLMLVSPRVMFDVIGIALFAAVIVLQKMRKGTAHAAA